MGERDVSDAAAKKSDLGVRTGSAVVMLAVTGTALWLGGWWWTALVALVAAGVLYEWQKLVR
jgi:phosphatidate cytidylyltransferase